MIAFDKTTLLIKQEAHRLGFSACGIAKATFLEEDAKRLESWLNKGLHGKMSYMENHFDKRTDPRKLVDGAQSVISLMYNYYPKEQQIGEGYKISKYAYGEDYHKVIKHKLKGFLDYITSIVGEVNGRVFVDSAPVLDKAWATKSGLGWIGKNGMLINKQKGSFYFLAEIIVDIPLSYDVPVQEFCGTCTACIDGCPTDAILPNKVIDATKCISYLTIELKDEILPKVQAGKMEDWIFGCDICQDVCPWNKFSTPHNEPLFDANGKWMNKDKKEWEELTEEIFQDIFKKSAVKRTKYKGLMRNIAFAKRGEKK